MKTTLQVRAIPQMHRSHGPSMMLLLVTFQRELQVSIMSVQEEMQQVMQDTLCETLDRAFTERALNRGGLDDRHVDDRLQPFPHRDRDFGDDGCPRGR